MPSQPIDTGWGFNAVIDLIESDLDIASPSLSTASTVVPNDSASQTRKNGDAILTDSPSAQTYSVRLGDFTKLFGELGISLPDPIALASPVDSEELISSDDVLQNEDTGVSSDGERGDPDSPLAGLIAKQNKQARKKAAKKERKARKALEATKALDATVNPWSLSISNRPTIEPRTRSNVGAKIRPATPVSQIRGSKPQSPVKILQYPRDVVGPTPVDLTAPPKDQPEQMVKITTSVHVSPDDANEQRSAQVQNPSPLPSAPVDGNCLPRVKLSLRSSHGLVPRTVQTGSTSRMQTVDSAQAASTPFQQPVTVSLHERFTPGYERNPVLDASYQAPASAHQTPYKLSSPNLPTTPFQIPVTPFGSSRGLTIRPKTERNFHFINQLLAKFPADAQWLLDPMSLSNQETKAQGIHCFVDGSNIMIGFRDMLKKYGQQHLEMSFDSLVLLMERRRPTAKRVYAGSQREAAPLPHVQKLVDTSKSVGYENIVREQVFIRRDDSERKKFFKDVERLGWINAKQLRSSPGSGSDSETGQAASTPASAPKWVEQGVDELLHLKMCQSIIDTEVPTTMVLATGDGNTAEFSDGFLANVERALKNGWTVELVSWKQQMSAGYRNKKFRTKWGDQFKVIELDEYLEGLIDTA